MGYWARQDTLNDKLGESVNLNKGANYWPTKTEILDNWNAEVPDTYAANQWCDIDDIKEGAVMLYRRYFWTQAQLSNHFKYSDVFEGLVGESKCDVCLISRGGNGGLWTAWGTGFGGAGGGGNVHNYMGVYFTKWHKANTRENLNPADNMILTVANSVDNNQFSVISFIKTSATFGVLLSNMKAASTGEDSTPNNTNGGPGNGGGAYVCDFVYSDKENCIIDTAATGTINKTLLNGTHNTSRNEPSRSQVYELKGDNWDLSKSIGEFNENYVLHAAPGVECWYLHRDSYITPTKNQGTPQQYVGTCPFNHGGGSIMYTNNREGQQWNNKGGRGGGGAGGGAGGGDYIDTVGSGRNQDTRHIGGDGAVIIRYMGKRVFPAGRTWTIKFRVQLFLATPMCVGFMLEGRSFEYFPMTVKNEEDDLFAINAPFGVYNDLTAGLNPDITVSNVLPEGFEPTKAWLILATNKPELSSPIVASIMVNDLNDSTNYVKASKTANLKSIKDDYIGAKKFIDHVKPNNRALQYIDITDVLRNSKSADAAKNSYYIGVNLVGNHQPVTRSYIFRKDKTPEALGDFILQPTDGAMEYLDALGNPVSGYLQGFEFQNQLDYRPKPYNTEKTLIRFSAGCSRVSAFTDVKYQDTTKFPTSNFIEVTHYFSDIIPTGYRLGFEANKRIGLQANAITLARDYVTVKYPLNCWHPNTNLIKCGEVFGEYWIEADTGTMVIREYQMTLQLGSDYTINVPTFSISAKNLTTNETINAMPMPSDGSAVEKIRFGLMIQNYNATDIIEVTLDFNVSNTPNANYVSIGGSGLYTYITDTKIAIQNNMSVFNPASPNSQNLGSFAVYNFQNRYLEWAYTPGTAGEECAALDFDREQFNPLDISIGNSNSSMIKFKPVNSSAVGVVEIGGKSYLKYRYNQFSISQVTEVSDYVEATFKLKMPSNLVNAGYKVKASNVHVGAGLPTYPTDSTIRLNLPLIHFHQALVVGALLVSAKYMVEPQNVAIPDFEVEIINQTGSSGTLFLFDEITTPVLSGIQYFALQLLPEFGSIVANLIYDSKGVKTITVNTGTGTTKKVGFGDKIKVYQNLYGGSSTYTYLGTITLDGNPTKKTFNV